jgi:hypothetical protein
VSSTCDVVLLCMLGMATAQRLRASCYSEKRREMRELRAPTCAHIFVKEAYEECFVDNLALAPVTKAVKT